MITCLYKRFKEKMYLCEDKYSVKLEATFVLFMLLLPLSRYFIYANHVIIHNWVTYHILEMSIFAFNVFWVRYCFGKIGKYESA